MPTGATLVNEKEKKKTENSLSSDQNCSAGTQNDKQVDLPTTKRKQSAFAKFHAGNQLMQTDDDNQAN